MKPPGTLAQCPSDIPGDLGDTVFEVHHPLEMTTTTKHLHFANDAQVIAQTRALVATCEGGSPLADAPRHTIQISLTPVAAASLYRLLNLLPGDMSMDMRDLHDGLRAASILALEQS